MTGDAWRPGARVGPFQLEGALGRGGMAEVFSAVDLRSGARVAVKTLPLGADLELRLRFRREGEAQARVDAHPHVARVHAAGEDAGRAWLAVELCPGGDLAARLARGPLPWREAAGLVRDLARGVAHAHAAGVLHRDLKPANVLFDEAGRARLVDFGLARVLEADRLTATGALLGTPAYMAPEQARGEPATVATDVHGLGALLHACLTGEPPFTGASVADVLAQVAGRVPTPPSVRGLPAPRAVEDVLARCLAKRPVDRFPDAASVAAALDAALAAPADGPLGAERRRAAGWALATGLALAIAAVGGALVGREAPRAPDAGGPRGAGASPGGATDVGAVEAQGPDGLDPGWRALVAAAAAWTPGRGSALEADILARTRAGEPGAADGGASRVADALLRAAASIPAIAAFEGAATAELARLLDLLAAFGARPAPAAATALLDALQAGWTEVALERAGRARDVEPVADLLEALTRLDHPWGHTQVKYAHAVLRYREQGRVAATPLGAYVKAYPDLDAWLAGAGARAGPRLRARAHLVRAAEHGPREDEARRRHVAAAAALTPEAFEVAAAQAALLEHDAVHAQGAAAPAALEAAAARARAAVAAVPEDLRASPSALREVVLAVEVDARLAAATGRPPALPGWPDAGAWPERVRAAAEADLARIAGWLAAAPRAGRARGRAAFARAALAALEADDARGALAALAAARERDGGVVGHAAPASEPLDQADRAAERALADAVLARAAEDVLGPAPDFAWARLLRAVADAGLAPTDTACWRLLDALQTLRVRVSLRPDTWQPSAADAVEALARCDAPLLHEHLDQAAGLLREAPGPWAELLRDLHALARADQDGELAKRIERRLAELPGLGRRLRARGLAVAARRLGAGATFAPRRLVDEVARLDAEGLDVARFALEARLHAAVRVAEGSPAPGDPSDLARALARLEPGRDAVERALARLDAAGGFAWHTLRGDVVGALAAVVAVDAGLGREVDALEARWVARFEAAGGHLGGSHREQLATARALGRRLALALGGPPPERGPAPADPDRGSAPAGD